jgi:hypothetical protein
VDRLTLAARTRDGPALETVALYEQVLGEWNQWPEDLLTQPIPDNDAWGIPQEDFIKDNIAWWRTEAEVVPLSGYRLVLDKDRGLQTQRAPANMVTSSRGYGREAANHQKTVASLHSRQLNFVSKEWQEARVQFLRQAVKIQKAAIFD